MLSVKHILRERTSITLTRQQYTIHILMLKTIQPFAVKNITGFIKIDNNSLITRRDNLVKFGRGF